MGYAVDVIKEILNLTDTLNGKQQLCLIRRASNGIEKVFIVYNYVYKDNETIGLCFVFNDIYPQNVKYLFTFCGQVLSKIVNEGKVLYLDEFGVLHSNIGDGNNFSSLYKKHLAEARSKFEPKKGDFTQVPPTYFSNFKNQHAIFQLSDQSWTMSEALLYNNVVIITEEIEEENIKSMRSFIKKSNETIGNLNKKIASLEAQLKRVEKENKNVSGGKRHFGAIHYIFIITCLLIMITVLTHECPRPRLPEQTVDYIIEDTTENNAKTEPFIDTIPNESFISTPDTSSVVTSVTDFNVLNSDNDLLYVYTGEVVNSAPHGYGKAIYTDGREYEGFFVNGERNGENARFVFSDGNLYEGTFVNDHIGTGRLTSKQKSSFGTYFIGSFKDDKPYNGTWYNKDGKIISEIHGQ